MQQYTPFFCFCQGFTENFFADYDLLFKKFESFELLEKLYYTFLQKISATLNTRSPSGIQISKFISKTTCHGEFNHTTETDELISLVDLMSQSELQLTHTEDVIEDYITMIGFRV